MSATFDTTLKAYEAAINQKKIDSEKHLQLLINYTAEQVEQQMKLRIDARRIPTEAFQFSVTYSEKTNPGISECFGSANSFRSFCQLLVAQRGWTVEEYVGMGLSTAGTPICNSGLYSLLIAIRS